MTPLCFETPPAVGTTLLLDDQEYELIAVEDYQRTDGTPSKLLRWRSACPTCGDEFQATTGLRGSSINRRCELHRRLGKPVKGKRGRAVNIRVVEA